MMALIKTPYGLVYNTDGTLCTTYRDDVVPFRGVRSFAVETATTNLISNPQFLDGMTGYRSNNFGGGGYIEAVNGIAHMHNENGTKYLALLKDLSGLNTTLSYTLSAKVRSANNKNIFVDAYLGATEGKDVYYPLGTAPASGEWVIVKYTYSPGQFTANPVMHLKIAAGAYLQVDWIQLEQKPFASSFVVGSRPKGRLVISVEDLMFDIANDDWVISYWKYPVATLDDTQNGYNICSLGQYTSDNSKGYIWWGKERSTNKYCLFIALNDATGVNINSDNTFNPTDYFYHWHYEVVKKSGKVLSYYVDGVKQCELIIPENKEIQTPFDVGLSLGGNTGNNKFNPDNTLIAAPYYGYNSATWTDDYIREVYEAKIPFAVQNQLSIY